MSVWKRLWGWRRLERELDEELEAHLLMATADRIARGEEPADAERNARREFGNQLLIRETTRDMWGFAAIERLGQDLRYVFRQMRRSPGFTAAAVLTLALGLGGATAVFSIVDRVLLRPLKFPEPERLYLARSLPPARAGLKGDYPVNARHFDEWRTHCESCEQVSLFDSQALTLVGSGEPVRLPALRVSFNFFRTLGVNPSLGRDFVQEEELPGHSGVVLIADALWRNRFGADRSIVGRAIQINGESHTVIGVLRADLHLPRGDQWGEFFGGAAAPLIFRPLGFDVSRQSPNGSLNYSSVVRLKRGAGPERAMAEMNALLAGFMREHQLEGSINLIPLQRQMTRNSRSALWLLLGAVGAVLLIVCVNVGNLMLVRNTGRYREAAVRVALGASRSGLFGLVLKEALVLVTTGGGLGLLIAYWALKVFVAAAPVGLPRLDEIQMDWRILIFAGLAIGFSTIACGLFPAWRLASADPQNSLKAGSANSTETGGKLRIREILVGVEVALSTVLLIAGGLLMVSFLRLMGVEKGFEVTQVITQDVSFLSPKYRGGVRARFVEEMSRKLAQIPGVRMVGAVSQLPLRGETWADALLDANQPERPLFADAQANFRFATPNYWQAMGIPLKQGRYLEELDKDLPRAVISERAAAFLWPNQNPIGKHIRGTGPHLPLEVVGVVGEVRAGGLEQQPPMTVYEDYWRWKPIAMSFVLRTQSDPASVIGPMRAMLASADPEMALSPAMTMEQIVDETVASRRFQMRLAAGFAISALLLASLGIYGVISFTVARRTPEMGIRIALGAGGTQLVGMIVRQGMVPVVFGLAGGLSCALGLGRLIASQLYGVTPNDPLTISGVAILLLVVAIGACWIPARRATKIDPLRALRFD